mgnify:CR=1 FL=1
MVSKSKYPAPGPQRHVEIHDMEVRESRTGYLIPARDGPGALPDMDSSWDVAVAAAAVAVSCQNVTLISFSFRA